MKKTVLYITVTSWVLYLVLFCWYPKDRDYFFTSEAKGTACTEKEPCSSHDLEKYARHGDKVFFQTNEKWLYDPTIKLKRKSPLWERIAEYLVSL